MNESLERREPVDMDLGQLNLNIKVEYDYNIYFTHNAFSLDNFLIRNVISSKETKRKHRVLFVIEGNLLRYFPSLIENITNYCGKFQDKIFLTSPPLVKTGGESLKSFDIIADLCEEIEKNHLCRQSFICIMGGGAFLDTVGFAASIVHRGIRQIRFPTTVLAQADSGVGVKNGLNMFGKKNFIGCFAPPFAVVNDFDFLYTLEDRDWISGIAEAFKVALIKDGSFFGWLCDNVSGLRRRDSSLMENLVYCCAKLHIEHIAASGDPFEFGSARPLDFGHWAAHKLEMLSAGNIRHGEAVAIGLMLDSFYAVYAGFLKKSVFERLAKAFSELGFKLWSEYLERRDTDGKLAILSGMEEFREHLGGELHITLPDGVGRKQEVNSMDEAVILSGLDYLRKSATK